MIIIISAIFILMLNLKTGKKIFLISSNGKKFHLSNKTALEIIKMINSKITYQQILSYCSVHHFFLFIHCSFPELFKNEFML